MSIEEIGSVAELISSIAVLVSLIYLGVQIRNSTEAARTSTYHEIVAAFGGLNQTMAGSPDLSLLYVSALEDFEALTAAERARISQLFYQTFRYFENMFYQHQRGYLEDDVWIGWNKLMITYFRRPGFQTWWALRREAFSSGFVAYLESEEAAELIPSYRDIVAAGAGRAADVYSDGSTKESA